MSIDDDKKRKNASVENSLIKKVKIKNEFEGKQKKKKQKKKNKKNRKRSKKSYTQRVKERMGEYYEEKPVKIHAKRKRDKYGEISNVIKKQWKCYKKKTDEGTNNDSWIKQGQIFTRGKENYCYQENLTLILKKF